MELPVDNSPLSTAPALGGEAREQTTGMRNRVALKCTIFATRVPKKWRIKKKKIQKKKALLIRGVALRVHRPRWLSTSWMIICGDLSWSNYCKAWRIARFGMKSFRKSNYLSPIQPRQTGVPTRKASAAGWGWTGRQAGSSWFYGHGLKLLMAFKGPARSLVCETERLDFSFDLQRFWSLPRTWPDNGLEQAFVYGYWQRSEGTAAARWGEKKALICNVIQAVMATHSHRLT